MRLHYFNDPNGNFGDDLNPWLWNRLLPGFFDDDPSELFVGIGTLLNHRLPRQPHKHVFGSGVGYGNPPIRDHRLVIHAVRGPMSAAALGIPAHYAITDAAVLIRLAAPRASRPRTRCGLILTGHSLLQFDWESVCRDAGIRFISCHWSVNRVLAEMSACEMVLCEAMHGAIVADALRIPWVPVSLYGRLLEFKWQDWLASLKMEYRPQRIASLHGAPPLGRRIKDVVKRRLIGWGTLPAGTTLPAAPERSSRHDYERAVHDLEGCARLSGSLSDERLLDEHVERYLQLFKTTFGASLRDSHRSSQPSNTTVR